MYSKSLISKSVYKVKGRLLFDALKLFRLTNVVQIHAKKFSPKICRLKGYLHALVKKVPFKLFAEFIFPLSHLVEGDSGI